MRLLRNKWKGCEKEVERNVVLKLTVSGFIVESDASLTNPETGEPWGEPEISMNISHDLLGLGQPLDKSRIRVLIAFLKTLTDKRYEALLED